MSDCPFCEIKANASKRKIQYPFTGKNRCECGAWLDSGQMTLTVNGYKEIYEGAVRLISDVVEQFKDILEYCDVDTKEYGDVNITLNASQIIERLFIPYEGGTSKANFKRAIGIQDDYAEFELVSEEDE